MEGYPNSQASTQAFRETQEIADVPVDFGEIDAVWGRLFSVRDKLSGYNLKNESHSFGRGDVDHRFDSNQFSEPFLSAISKTHFRVRRERTSATEVCVVLEDLSANGTFINEQLVGKGKKKILQNNDEISLAHSTRKVFVFHDCEKNDDANYPEQLTQYYTMTKKLGEGTFGEVRLGYRQETMERVAVKVLKRKGSQLLLNSEKQIDNEIKLLQSVNHPNIIKLEDVIDTPEKIFIVMEVAEGGELFDRLVANKRLPEMTVKFYFYQLVLAIEYLHKKKITHRDIKPENVLLATDKEWTHIKLTDFGLSRLAADTSQMTTFCGTPTYIAPELLDFGQLSYTNKVDMWSLGVLLYVSLVGYPPFNLENDTQLRNQIKNAIYNFNHKLWKPISEDAKDLIKKLMVKDPRSRLSATETLKHPWLQDKILKAKLEDLENGNNNGRKRQLENGDKDNITMGSPDSKSPRLNQERCINDCDITVGSPNCKSPR